VGVGYYPNSVFIHLDSRDRDGYWIDYSRPGEKAIYGKAGMTADEIERIRLARKASSTGSVEASEIEAEVEADVGNLAEEIASSVAAAIAPPIADSPAPAPPAEPPADIPPIAANIAPEG